MHKYQNYVYQMYNPKCMLLTVCYQCMNIKCMNIKCLYYQCLLSNVCYEINVIK
jgi:hypothetical protein